jgi:hypothetical protein
MKATITYRVAFVSNPWGGPTNRSSSAWCVVKVTTPELGSSEERAVAIFNLDSEAQAFMSHVYAAGLADSLVSIDPDFKELCDLRRWRG